MDKENRDRLIEMHSNIMSDLKLFTLYGEYEGDNPKAYARDLFAKQTELFLELIRKPIND